MKKATDDDIKRAYTRTKSIWKVAKLFGMCGQSVQERLVKLDIEREGRGKKWTKEEEALLVFLYKNGFKRGDGQLDNLLEVTGRTKQYISRKAKLLGLTSRNRNIDPELIDTMAKRTKLWIKDNGHPKGSLGLKHTDEVKEIISKKSIKSWATKTEDEKAETILKMLKTKTARGTHPKNREKATWKCGWREIGGQRKYYRSRWEANYARFLQWLKERGDIVKWEHEPETFWFEQIKRGCRSYLPDFRVTENNGNIVYHEVKGWMDDRSKTKIKRMAKYYPKTKLIIIDGPIYKDIKKKMSRLIDGWE